METSASYVFMFEDKYTLLEYFEAFSSFKAFFNKVATDGCDHQTKHLLKEVQKCQGTKSETRHVERSFGLTNGAVTSFRVIVRCADDVVAVT